MSNLILVFLFVIITQFAIPSVHSDGTFGLSSSWITNGRDAARKPRRRKVGAAGATALEVTTRTDIDELTQGRVIPAPEPSTLLLFGSGLLLVGAFLRVWMRKSKPPSCAYPKISAAQFPTSGQRDLDTDHDGADAFPVAYGARENLRDEDRARGHTTRE